MAALPPGLENLLTEGLVERFPDKVGLKVKNVEVVTNGWETDIYFVRFGFLQNGNPAHQDLVVRLYDNGPVSSAQFRKDAYMLHELANHGIRVPRVELLVSSDTHSPQALVMSLPLGGPNAPG